MPIRIVFILMLALLGIQNAAANEVEIVNVMLEPSAHRWTFHVTLKHDDTGWDHYADDWRIVDAKGTELGNRKLWHPHPDEQPFTRNLSNVTIPDDINTVFIEAHDKVHGWNPQRLEVNLQQAQGERYRVRR